MSTHQRPSLGLRVFVPVYLLLVGIGLLVGAVLVYVYLPDEWFIATMAAIGGATMLVTILALMTVARNR